MSSPAKIRIGINLLFVRPGVTGGNETHAVELLKALGRIDGENAYFLFMNRASEGLQLSLPPNFRRVRCSLDGGSRSIRYLWEQFVLPWLLLYYRIDVFHSMAYVGPVLAPCASLVTTHDLNFLSPRHAMGLFQRVILGSVAFILARRSRFVLTVSEYSRQEIVVKLGLPRERVLIIPNAVNLDEVLSSRKRSPVEGAYIVAFAGGGANKNIPRLISAFGQIADRIGHRLVLVGTPHDSVRVAMEQQPYAVRQRVVLTGFVCRDDLLDILAGAELFVFPSLFEGFGIPILEANVLAVPILCSSAASLPEVAGDAAVFFDPFSVTELAGLIVTVLKDERLKAELRERGRINAARFSWEASARRLHRTYTMV